MQFLLLYPPTGGVRTTSLLLLLLLLLIPYMEMSDVTLSRKDVRIVGPLPRLGRVEIRVNGTWGTLCDVKIRHTTAGVICSMLGFIRGSKISQDLKPLFRVEDAAASTPIYLREVGCEGSESTISNCQRGDFYDTAWCGHRHDLAVICDAKGDVHLSGLYYGVLGVVDPDTSDVYRVCLQGLSAEQATLACRELGLDAATIHPGNTFQAPQHGKHVTYTSSSCPAKATQLSKCGGKKTESRCPDDQEAGVICTRNGITYQDYVSLQTHSSHRCANDSCGRVVVTHLGVDGSVCDDDWTEQDADVMCRQLGFTRGLPICCGAWNWPRLPAWLHRPKCKGTEQSLLDCPRENKLGDVQCSATGTAGTICYNTSQPVFPTGRRVRLSGDAKNTYGYVEVSYHGVWGGVSDTNWTLEDARVICREILPDFVHAIPVCCERMGRASEDRPVLLFDPDCEGTEASVTDCPHASWADRNRTMVRGHNYDVAVMCINVKGNKAPEYRLSNPGSNYGMVEVKYKGTWGRVCSSHGWDHVAATVLCRSLGYRYGLADYGLRDWYPLNIIWMSRLVCKGGETTLDRCAFEGWGNTECYVWDQAYAACSNEPGVQLRLVGGGLSYGRLEASLGGQLWGAVSCDGFDDSCALTFCRQLGYDFGRQRKGAGTHVSRSGEVFLQFKKGCSSGKKRLLDETPRSAWGNVVKAGWCGVGVSLYCLQNDTGGCGPAISLGGSYGTLHAGFGSTKNCRRTWEISVPIGYRVVLTFQELKVGKDTSRNDNCVQIREGGESGSILLSHRGGSRPPVTRSRGSMVTVSFKSDTKHASHGFAASYRAECLGREKWKFTRTIPGLSGWSYQTLYKQTLGRCLDVCSRNASCEAVYFSVMEKTCFLDIPNLLLSQEISVDKPLREYKPSCQQACKGLVKWEPSGLAAVGNDIIKATVDDVTACEILCDVHSSCVRLYYDAATKTCYVGLLEHYEENVTNAMSKVVAQQLSRKCHACEKSWITSPGKIYTRGAALKEYRHTDLVLCQALCEATAGCKSLVFDKHARNCRLFGLSAIDGATTKSGTAKVMMEQICKGKSYLSIQHGTRPIRGLRLLRADSTHTVPALECVADCQRHLECTHIGTKLTWGGDVMCFLYKRQSLVAVEIVKDPKWDLYTFIK